MPFLGARTRVGKFQINAKAYGPDNHFVKDTNVILLERVKDLTEEDMMQPESAAKVFASRIVKSLSFDPNVAWVECEIIHESGMSFGDVALAEEN